MSDLTEEEINTAIRTLTQTHPEDYLLSRVLPAAKILKGAYEREKARREETDEELSTMAKKFEEANDKYEDH